KTTLTIEESARLFELGVDAEKASKCRVQHEADFEVEYRIVLHDEFCYEMASLNPQPIFDLSDLLSILPKEIDYNGLTYRLNMWVDKAIWYVEYVAEVEFNQWDTLNTDNFESPELIDTLYHQAIWCLENGHLKTEKK
ncbi:MAG: hypothetical protein K2N25_01300, partial [Muribaculaceae bacterium]|nr:hypothetical protein [Muribaculaceae bacterium]